MNHVSLIGRLTKDPDVKSTSTGKLMARMTIAVDRQRKRDGQQQADFISLVAWEKTAEFAEKYLHKGSKVGIEGRIQTGSYEKDGRKIYTTDVVVVHMDFCDSRGSSGNDAPANGEAEEEIPLDVPW